MANSGKCFLITADISDGIVGNDRSSVSVWDVFSWEQVAHWLGYRDPSQMGFVIRDIGAYYNWGMIAVETNYPGNATLQKLQDLNYPKLWTDEHGEPWKTTAKTRPLMISALREALRESTLKINSEDMLLELGTFVRRENGRLEAEPGTHDDCVMDCAIAAYILKHTAFEDDQLAKVVRRPLREILKSINPGGRLVNTNKGGQVV